MNYFLGISFIFILWFLINNFRKKKRLKKFKASLYKNWGTPKKKEYYNFFVISKYFNNNRHKEKAHHILSEKSKIDFDIDDIFKFVDRTSSKIGQQYLYFKLRTIGSLKKLKKFDELTTLFQKNKDLSISCQVELSKLNNNNSYYLEELINDKQLDKPKHLWIVKGLTITAISSIILLFFYPIFSLLLIPIFSVNLFFHYKNKHSVAYYLNGVTQLSRTLKVSQKLAKNPEIAAFFKDISFIENMKAIKFKTEFIAFEKNVTDEYLFFFWFLQK